VTKARRIALRNCADAIEADVANGAEYIGQDPDTHEDLPEKMRDMVEREMKAIAARLVQRASSLKV
jgi:hypothetical protein